MAASPLSQVEICALLERETFPRRRSVVLEGVPADMSCDDIEKHCRNVMGQVVKVVVLEDSTGPLQVLVELEEEDKVQGLEAQLNLTSDICCRVFKVTAADSEPTAPSDQHGGLQHDIARITRELFQRKEAEERMLTLLDRLTTSVTRMEAGAASAPSTMEPPHDSPREGGSVEPATLAPTPPTITIPVQGGAGVQQRINVEVQHTLGGDRGGYYRVKPFSGVTPPKQGEGSFAEWTTQIRLILEDEAVTERGKRQRLLASLHSPALEIARGLGEALSASELFAGLRKFYENTANGAVLLQQFFSMSQKSGESPSEYLVRLQLKMDDVVEKRGLQAAQVNETRLTHFRSSCSNDTLANLLQIKYGSTQDSPSFTELMMEVKRVEDDHRVSKKVRSQGHTVSEGPSNNEFTDLIQSQQALINDLRQQLVRSSPQVASGISIQRQEPEVASYGNGSQREQSRGQKKRRSNWTRVCYNCGSYEHVRTVCTSPKNPSLVWERINARTDRSKPSGDLNGQRSLPN